MSLLAIDLYEKLTEAVDDKTRSRLIVQALSELDNRYPDLKDMATRRDLSETELRLRKETETIRLEIKQLEVSLRQEIESTRAEIKQLEVNSQRQIEATRVEMKQLEVNLQKEMRQIEVNLQKEMRQIEVNLQKEMRQIEVNLRKEIESTRVEIKQLEVQLARAMHRQTLWIVGSVGSIIALIRLLDWFLTHSLH